MTSVRVKLGSPPRWWTILFAPLRRSTKSRNGYAGLCYFEERIILLDQDLKDRQLIETTIHEAIHGADPDMSEARVTRIAQQANAALEKVVLLKTKGGKR